MTRLLIILFLLVLPIGCSTNPTPYGTIGIGYQLDQSTDYWLQTERSWQCSKQPQAHFEVGLEFDHKLTIGYHHQSWYRCGGPFNDRPEVYTDDIRIQKKFGGK